MTVLSDLDQARLRAHIESIRARGYGYERIARMSGVGRSTVAAIARRERPAKPESASRILGVDPSTLPDLAAARQARAAIRAARQPRPRPRPRAEVIEDVEWLIGTDHPDTIATRVGYRDHDTLASTMRRWGRQDLAARLVLRELAAA